MDPEIRDAAVSLEKSDDSEAIGLRAAGIPHAGEGAAGGEFAPLLRTPLWWDGEPPAIPLPEPDPAPLPDEEAPSSFSWSFDDVEEVRESSPTGRRIVWAAGAALAVVLVGAVVVGVGDDGSEPRRPASAPNAPGTGAPASLPGPPEAYTPRGTALGGFDGRVQVTWQAPENVEHVVGYMAIAQSRQGVVLEHQLLPPGATSAVFASPPITRDACVVIASLVRGGSGVVPVRAEPVCL